MVQVIPQQGNIFGRLGHGIGQGLNEQGTKEIERSRLSSGLKKLGEQKGLSQFEQFTGLVSAAHEYPQVVQSGAELLKQKNLREAYKRGRTPGQEFQPQNTKSSPDLQDVKFGQKPGQVQRNNQSENQQQTIPSNQSRKQESTSNPPAGSENPLLEKYVPPSPWNQQRDEQSINEAFDRGLATTFPEAREYADRQKQLYENAPEKYREQLEYKKGIDQQTDDLFDKHLQTRLQKKGSETFADIPGDLQLNIKKKARNSVATGKMTPDQAAEYYSKKALDLAKDKNLALKIANRDVLDRLLPYKKEEAIKNLSHIAENYEDMGSDEDFYNFLITDKLNDNGQQEGMGLSPGGAALIQYKRTPKVKSLIKNTKISSKNPSESTRAFAENLFNDLTPKDSFLAIARQMKQQDPNFDEYAFFDYLRENKDRYGSIPRLDREVSNGVSDFFPNWRDIGLFPAFTKSVAND